MCYGLRHHELVIRLILYSPNQKNRLYLEGTPSNTQFYWKRNEPIFLFQTGKKRNTKQLPNSLPWRHMESPLSCHKAGDWQVLSESERSTEKLLKQWWGCSRIIQGIFSVCGHGVVCTEVVCMVVWEVNKHGLNLWSSILFRGGRKAKERKKEMKTELWLSS